MKNACSWTERNFRLFVIASDNILSVPYSLKYVESLLLGTVKRANQHFDIKNPPEKFLQQTPNLEPSLFKTKYTHFKKPFHVAPFISSSVIQNHSRRHRSRKWGPANQPDVFSARLSRPCSTPQGLFGQAPFRVTWLPRFFFQKQQQQTFWAWHSSPSNAAYIQGQNQHFPPDAGCICLNDWWSRWITRFWTVPPPLHLLLVARTLQRNPVFLRSRTTHWSTLFLLSCLT